MNNTRKEGMMLNSPIKKIKKWFIIKKQIRKIKKDFKKPRTFIY
jgi:hypothetical protein